MAPSLQRDAATFTLRTGEVYFSAPIEGRVTTAVFIGDGEMTLVYRGQLDDSRPRRGDFGNDIPVTGKDLRAAMDAVIAGKRPDPNQRFAVGCNIKWKE